MTTNDGKQNRKTYPGGASLVRETALAYGDANVGVRELRQNLSVYLDEVKQGRSLVVTEHGQQVAMLTPLPPVNTVLDRLIREGKVTRPTRRIADLPKPLPPRKGKPLSQMLIEMRDEDPW
jgi:prevent-host-death family protein